MSGRLLLELMGDWEGLGGPVLLGRVQAQPTGASEIFSVIWDEAALADAGVITVDLDPQIPWGPGPHYPSSGRQTFGLLQDISPDRWGRLLMERRRERARRTGHATAERLRESDFLMGVHDHFRLGGIRLRRPEDGAWLSSDDGRAAPPMVRLRQLEAACRAVEDDASDGDKLDEWLRLLIAPGGSLGGARPKASVVDERGAMWIAKFPSVRDTTDMGAWELLATTLARASGVQVPESWARTFASARHTYLVKRFDRTASGGRLHMASAMTLTGHQDGDGADTGASYLELADVIVRQGSEPHRDLGELWRRIVFNLLVSNTDDHLRNHAFLLDPGRGWRLAPAYDMNPDPSGKGLKLNISEVDNAPDLDLVAGVAAHFRVDKGAVSAEIARMQRVVRSWPKLATRLGISKHEQARMAPAFRLALPRLGG
jgi:serine/threonine-protein kinase HipA